MNFLSLNRYWIAVFMAIIFYCYEFLLRVSPSVIIPELMRHYQITALQIGGMTSLYYVAYGLGQLPAGVILDRFATRWVLTAATLSCALGVIFFAMAHSFYLAKISQIIIGFGSAFSFVGALTIINRYLPKKNFTFAVGLTIALGTLAASYTDVLTSYLISSMAWEKAFYCFAIAGIVIALLLFIVFSVVKAPFHPSPSIITWSGNRQEIKVTLKNSRLWKNGVIGGLLYVPTSIIANVWGVTFLERAYLLTKMQSSVCISLVFLGWVIGSPITSWLCDRYRCEKILVLVGSLSLLSICTLFIYRPLLITPHLHITLLLLGLCSSCQLVIWRVFKKIAPDTASGLAAALTNTIIMLLTALVNIMVSALIDIRLAFNYSALVHHGNANYQLALTLLPLSIVIAILLFFWPTHRSKHESINDGCLSAKRFHQ